MRISPTPLPGAVLLEPQRHGDERGSFARIFCQVELRAAGIDFAVAQANLSANARRGTLRGLHFQTEPHEEAKIVGVTRGAVFDAIVDLRPASPTFLRSFTVTLDATAGTLLHVPAGCAHGFLTLADDSELLYLMSSPYVPGAAHGYRWDDPAFAIPWPEPPVVLSERDQELPTYSPAAR